MLTRYVHACDESAAVEKLREIVADDSDSKLVIKRYRVFRVKRTMWQRAVGDDPKWKVEYSVESDPSFESPPDDLVPDLNETIQDNWHETVQETAPEFVSEIEQTTTYQLTTDQLTTEQTTSATGFESKSSLELQPESSSDGSLDTTISSELLETLIENEDIVEEAELKEPSRENSIRVRRRFWKWFFRSESNLNEDQPMHSEQQNDLAVELEEISGENQDKSQQEIAVSHASETEHENLKLNEQELPNRVGWDTLVDSVFSDFDPKR